MKIRYFNIGWLSKVDGEGSRVVVFLQGCNLKCPWCHSPHSLNNTSPVLLNKNLCTLCGKCELACKRGVHKIDGSKHILNIDKCTSCGDCVNGCINSSLNSQKGALMLPTKEVEVSQLFSLIRPQLEMFKNIGGITLSGGEALMQNEAVIELLKLCKEQEIHTAVETNCLLPIENYKNVSSLVDYWMLGIRAVEESSSNFEKIYINVEFISSLKKDILVRLPVICGYTDSEKQLEATIKIMSQCSLNKIHILPCNKHMSHYYELMGKDLKLNDSQIPSLQHLEKIKKFFLDSNINIIY